MWRVTRAGLMCSDAAIDECGVDGGVGSLLGEGGGKEDHSAVRSRDPLWSKAVPGEANPQPSTLNQTREVEGEGAQRVPTWVVQLKFEKQPTDMTTMLRNPEGAFLSHTKCF